MNRNVWACSLAGGVLLLAGTLNAQQAPPPPGMGYHAEGAEEGVPGGPLGERIELLGFEGLRPGKVVKGAPFTATASSETTQTLQDGTKIDRTTSSTLYRDGQGRGEFLRQLFQSILPARSQEQVRSARGQFPSQGHANPCARPSYQRPSSRPRSTHWLAPKQTPSLPRDCKSDF